MSKNNFLLTLALALAAGVAGHALYGALASPQIAQARAASRDAGDVQWEYCAVLKAQYPNTVRFVYWIAYFKGEGVKTEDVESGPGGSAFEQRDELSDFHCRRQRIAATGGDENTRAGQVRLLLGHERKRVRLPHPRKRRPQKGHRTEDDAWPRLRRAC